MGAQRGVLVLLTGVLALLANARYDCSGYDEVKGEVQDSSGYVCGVKCAADTFNCPTDVPTGTSAQPQCMLQDVDRGSFCGLLCQVDSQCPNGARCRQMKQVEVGLCLYPVSFTDWARQSSNRKFNVGWPTRAGVSAGSGTSSSFEIAKTYAALQNLKKKFSIDDGDADMLTLKELLSSMTASSAVAAVPAASGATYPASMLNQGNQGGYKDYGWSAWTHDIGRFEDYVGDGPVKGIQREIKDTYWNIEHIEEYGKATILLRGVILWGFAYVLVGSFFKYQTGARGIDMIPHIGFWMEYPKLVEDGVTYSKVLMGMQAGSFGGDLLSGGIPGRSGGAGAFETL